MVKNGQKWSKMTRNGPKWSKMFENVWKLSNMVQNWPKLAKMVKNSPKWFKMIKKVSKCFKMDQNGPRWTIVIQKFLNLSQSGPKSSKWVRQTRSPGLFYIRTTFFVITLKRHSQKEKVTSVFVSDNIIVWKFSKFQSTWRWL